MTATTGTETTAKFIDDVTVASIAQHPDNPRHDVGDVTDLAVSIKDHGVLEPLIVVPFKSLPDDIPDFAYPKGATCVLIAGHRRLAAAKEAKVKTVPVIVRYDLTTRDQQVAAMVIENQHRADLSPVEEGEAYQLLLDITPASTQAKVAQAVGMPKKRVSERVRLTKLNDVAKAAIHDGQLSLTDALDILAIETRHPALAKKAALAAGSKDFPYELVRAKQDADVLDRYDRFRKHADELGTTVLAKAPGYGPSDPRKVGLNTRGLDDAPEDLDPADVALTIGTLHAACPGAAVYIPKQASGAYELGWYCTQFNDRHLPSREEQAAEQEANTAEREQRFLDAERAALATEEVRLAALTDKERAEEERAAAEKTAADQAHAERMAGLAAAQATRRAHFAEVIAKGDPKHAKAALIDVCAPSTFVGNLYAKASLEHDSVAKELLGLDTVATSDDVAEALRHLTIAQIALLMWFTNTAVVDDDLTLMAWQKDQALTPNPGYIKVLTDRYRYQWSTVEIEEFNLDERGHVRVDTEDDSATETGDAA